MNKFVLLGIFLISQSFAIDQAPIEMYPDEMPSIKLLWTGHFPDSCLEKGITESFFSGEKTDYFLHQALFNQFNLKKISLDGTYWVNNEEQNILFFASEEDPSLSLFLDFKIITSFEEAPILKKMNCKVHQSALSSQPWEYPRPVCYWMGQYSEVNEMSWQYVNLAVHSKPNLPYQSEYFKENTTEESLYKTIRRDGLQNTIVRSILTIDENGTACCYSIYNTNQEYQKNNQILETLKYAF